MFDRITYDPAIMNGQPIIRGMRFPVKTVVRMAAGGMTIEDIQQEHPSLDREDIHQALEFAAANVSGDVYVPLRRTA